jgi:hypothetical protein
MLPHDEGNVKAPKRRVFVIRFVLSDEDLTAIAYSRDGRGSCLRLATRSEVETVIGMAVEASLSDARLQLEDADEETE